MAIADGKLRVADIDHLRTFNVETGASIDSLEIEGAKFLNDVAIAADGTLYVTDSGTKDVPGAIYEVTTDGQVRRIAKGRDLDRPNGIDFDQDGNLIVVTFGADEVLTMSREGKVLNRRTLQPGQLDGLVVRDDGSKLVSSWKGENVIRISPDGATETILTAYARRRLSTSTPSGSSCWCAKTGSWLRRLPEASRWPSDQVPSRIAPLFSESGGTAPPGARCGTKSLHREPRKAIMPSSSAAKARPGASDPSKAHQ